jgi:hypothetical protein
MATDTERPILTAMDAVAQLAISLDAIPLHKHAGCWEHQIDKQWWIAFNGQKQAVECSKGISVDPYHVYIEFNGWPAGIINPFEGTLCAGEIANESTFIAAVEKATARAAIGGEDGE